MLLPQIIGFLAVASFLLSYQLKNRQHIIIVNTLSRCLYILQYLLLGAVCGAILDILGALAAIVAGKKDSPFIKARLPLVFAAVNAVILSVGLAIAWVRKSPLDLLPIVGVLLHTGAFWLSSEKIIRRISLLGSPFWLVYNTASRAYGSALGDVLTMCSIVVAMIKFRRQEKSVS